jgi:hypothetical protein
MRANRVVPVGVNGSTFQADRCLLLGGDPLPLVRMFVETSATMKTGIRARRPNVLQDRFVTSQRFAGPVRADQAEHAVIDWIPLRCPWGIVRHRDGQPELVGEFLQGILPLPFTMIVGASTVHLDQQPRHIAIALATHSQPPATNGSNLEGGRLLRDTNHHVAIVVGQIVNPCRVGSTFGPRWIVMVQHLVRTAAPRVSWILEIPDQLLFLAIHGNCGQISSQIPVAQPKQVAKLSITIPMTDSRFLLATRSQRESQTSQQTRQRVRRQPHSSTTQGLAELSQRMMRPFHAGDRIAGGGFLQKLLQGRQGPGRFSSKRFRPAPDRRTRLLGKRCFCRSSRLPSATVLRCIPVIRANCWIPPRPIFDASKPARSLRNLSSAAASRRLIARCSFATAARGWCRQTEQSQRWIGRT